MKKYILLLAVLSGSVYISDAQNLDPTVEVTRGYKAELADANKSSISMEVPDTVYRFDLDFDYSVFDNPYRGSYEFNPYAMDMKPQSAPYKPSWLYVNAGVGYTLHPVLDFYCSPVLNGRFGVDFSARHRSYFGDYRSADVGKTAGTKSFSNGYDIMSEAGVNLGYDWKKTAADLSVGYYGVAVKDVFHRDAFNALDASLSVKSKKHWKRGFLYDIGLRYRFGGNNEIREHLMGADIKLGPIMKSKHKIFVDFGMDMAIYGKSLSATFGSGYVKPHYVYEKDRLKVDLGARISYVGSADQNFAVRNQYVYPDLHMSFALIRDAMRFYVDVTGGERLNTYSSALSANHHFYSGYAVAGNALLGASVERVRPEVGFEGRITNFFTYDLKGGYVLSSGTPMEVLVRQADGLYRPALGYVDCQQAYAQFDWNMTSRSVKVDGSVKYVHTWDVPALGEGMYYVRPAEVVAEAAVEYNWNRRVFAGVECSAASISRTVDAAVYVPYYVDLGVYAEYVINRKMSVWLRGGNLLDMEIQRNPLFAEKGINFTAGICLTLQ